MVYAQTWNCFVELKKKKKYLLNFEIQKDHSTWTKNQI